MKAWQAHPKGEGNRCILFWSTMPENINFAGNGGVATTITTTAPGLSLHAEWSLPNQYAFDFLLTDRTRNSGLKLGSSAKARGHFSCYLLCVSCCIHPYFLFDGCFLSEKSHAGHEFRGTSSRTSKKQEKMVVLPTQWKWRKQKYMAMHHRLFGSV